MGRSVRRVVGVITSIVIPFVAPKIVGALAASSTVSGTALGAALSTTAGATAGSAVVGAGLGAVNARLTGGDTGQGALLGAVGGGIGGYMGATQRAAAQAAQATPVAGAAPPLAALPPAALPPAAPPSLSFTAALRQVPGAIATRFKDPKVLADLTLRAGASLLTGQLAGQGLSAQEQQLLQVHTDDLRALREQDEGLFKTRMQEAMNLIGEARYFDPNKFGIQAQTAIQVAGAQQMREDERQAALRPGTGGMTAADRRRAGLDIVARGHTAYMQGADFAQKQRLGLYQAGLNALPTAGPTAGLTHSSGLREAYNLAEERRRKRQADIGELFGSITGRAGSQAIG